MTVMLKVSPCSSAIKKNSKGESGSIIVDIRSLTSPLPERSEERAKNSEIQAMLSDNNNYSHEVSS